MMTLSAFLRAPEMWRDRGRNKARGAIERHGASLAERSKPDRRCFDTCGRNILKLYAKDKKPTMRCNSARAERCFVVFRKPNDSHGRFSPPFSLENDEACLLYCRCPNPVFDIAHNLKHEKGAVKFLA
ncbi:MAG: hypothetical protein ACI4MP_14220 [Candidatus Ventricola sp.]